MFLPAHGVCLDEPRLELVVEVIHSSEPESVEVIAGRERFDAPKSRRFETPSEDDVPVQPAPARGELREGHPHLKGDSSLLWEDADWPDGLNECDDVIE